MEALVPWVASLVRLAEKNWPKIVRFLLEEDNPSRVRNKAGEAVTVVDIMWRYLTLPDRRTRCVTPETQILQRYLAKGPHSRLSLLPSLFLLFAAAPPLIAFWAFLTLRCDHAKTTPRAALRTCLSRGAL